MGKHTYTRIREIYPGFNIEELTGPSIVISATDRVGRGTIFVRAVYLLVIMTNNALT